MANNIPKGSAETEDRLTGLGSISYVLGYFRDRFPDARIVWSTPIFRNDVDGAALAEFSSALKSVCPSFGAEVFDLASVCGIDGANYTQYLSDGIHPNRDGSQKLLAAYLDYFKYS